MSTYDNAAPLDGWVPCIHRPVPCMTAPAVEPSEDHLLLGEN